MLSLTPQPIELLSYDMDGKDSRHFSFRLIEPGVIVAPQPGQFFMLHVPSIGAAPFTFTSAPNKKGHFRALIKRMGAVTSALFESQPGAILGARGPFGKGWPLNQLSDQRILMIAGGCGLAPLVSLTETLLAKKNYQHLTLLYGAANAHTQLLNPERQRWRQQIAVYDVLEDHVDTDANHQQVLRGTTVDVLDTVLHQVDQLPTAVLLCGPDVMMQKIASKLTACDVPATSIWLSIERRMHCAVGLCGHCYLQDQYACKDGPTYRWDQFQSLLPPLPAPTNATTFCY